MSNPKTAELVAAVRCCLSKTCLECPLGDSPTKGYSECLTMVADRLEALEKELIDERYRHDRLQDFCVAQGEELSELKAQQRWIPVTEMLPEERVPVLTLGPQGGVGIGMYYGNPLDSKGRTWFYARHGNSQPTHWMPLPEPPKEE